MSQQNRKNKNELICRCNEVPREKIELAIKEGCKTLNEIFDCTNAGVGACGGSCRRKLAPMLDQYLKNKTFPTQEELQRLCKK